MPRPPRAREPLLAAALRLFVERGIDGTGIRDVAAAAGVSEAALYRHWASKDALVRDLYLHRLREVVDLMDVAIAPALSVDAALEAAVLAISSLFDRDPLVFRFVLLAQADVRLTPPDGVRTPLDVVHELAVRGVTGTQDPRHLAAAWAGLFLQTGQHVLMGRLPPPFTDHAPAVARLAQALRQV